MQKVAPEFRGTKFLTKRLTNSLSVMRFEKPLEVDVYLFNLFITFRETTYASGIEYKFRGVTRFQFWKLTSKKQLEDDF